MSAFRLFENTVTIPSTVCMGIISLYRRGNVLLNWIDYMTISNRYLLFISLFRGLAGFILIGNAKNVIGTI